MPSAGTAVIIGALHHGGISMKNLLKTILIAGGLAVGSQAVAHDDMLDYLLDACEADLQQYCSQVTPGQGRILHCVAAHEDKLSSRCEYALYQASAILEQVTAAIVYVARSCETEIKSLCADVEAGEGRILGCLNENEAKVGDQCKQAIADTVGE
jgi:hypothetical protein